MSTDIVRAAQAPLPAQSLDSQVRFAQLLADADLLPKQFVGRPANVLYAVEYGRTLGIAPVAAITGIHVIEGKPSASSGLIGALVRRAGHKLRVKSDGGRTATAQIIRSDDPDFVYEATWTLERAEQAGLCQIKNGKPFARDSKGRPTAWEKYPAAMLKARAITEVARDACEDVLFGLHYTPEELGAVVDQDGEPVEAPVQPLRVVNHETANDASTATPAGREYLREAHDAPDAAAVRQIWQDAKAEGAVPEYLAQIAQVGKEKAAAEQAQAEPADDVDAGLVPYRGEHGYPEGESPEELEHAAAEAELRALAAQLGIDDIDRDAEGALGCPIADASANAIRSLTSQLRGAA